MRYKMDKEISPIDLIKLLESFREDEKLSKEEFVHTKLRPGGLDITTFAYVKWTTKWNDGSPSYMPSKNNQKRIEEILIAHGYLQPA